MDHAAPITPHLLTARQAADAIGIHVRTLANWRVQGRGPTFVKVSRGKVAYLASDVDRFVLSHRFTSTTQAQSATGKRSGL